MFCPLLTFNLENSRFGVWGPRRLLRGFQFHPSQKIERSARQKIQFQKILKINQGASCDSGHFPATSLLPLVLQTTPLAPQVPLGSTPIDGGGILLFFFNFRHFRPERDRARWSRDVVMRGGVTQKKLANGERAIAVLKWPLMQQQPPGVGLRCSLALQ